MASIRPFRGLRYTSTAGPLSSLVAPPYDVLSPAERDELAAKSDSNIVHMTIPEQHADDRSKFIKYARSASKLEQLRRDGILAPEVQPAFYRYTQNFKIPGSDEILTRLALIALIKVEPYEKGVVLPHEQTFPKHKEDRLRILEATRAHLECIYGLYEDDDQNALKLVQQAPSQQVADVTTEDGVRHLIDVISDPGACEAIQRAIATKKVWIADGHHRYETALNFRAAQGDRDHEIPEDYMMMALSSISDPGLVLLPTHRILDKVSLSSEEIESAMRGAFTHYEVDPNEIVITLEKHDEKGEKAFGLALPGSKGLILTVDSPDLLVNQLETADSKRLKALDVTILHQYIFEKLLGLKGLEFFSYTRDPQEALDAVNNGAKASFLMNPPTVKDMREIALGGEKMPQKSTYYYPKILSGLALWSLNDF